MNRIMAFLFTCLVLVFNNAIAQDSTAAIPAKSADSNMSTVVFYRAADDGGKAYALTSQNTVLATLKKGGRFEQKLAAGTYYYMADPDTTQVFKIDVEAGKTYYIHASRDGSFFNGKPSLKLATAQDYQQAIASNN
jgi:hypothetical protein